MKQETITWFKVTEALPPIGKRVLVREKGEIGISVVSEYLLMDNTARTPYPQWRSLTKHFSPGEWALMDLKNL